MSDEDREWTSRDAQRERVSRRRCVNCKAHRQDLPPDISLYTIETGEVICWDCIREARRYKRDMSVRFKIDGDLPDHAEEVVRESFLGLADRLDGVSEVAVETPEGQNLIGLSIDEVEVEEDDDLDSTVVE